METNNSQDYTLDFLGNEVRKGDLVCAILYFKIEDIDEYKKTFVQRIVEYVELSAAYITVNGLERKLNYKSEDWFKASEISKLHPKCTTCKHFFVSEFTDLPNCAKNTYIIIQDAQKHYCSNHETNDNL